MKKISLIFLTILAISSPSYAVEPIKKYEEIKNEIVDLDETSREIMANIYQMNRRLKTLSSRRGKIAMKLLTKENEVKNLTKEIVDLENSLKEQRKILARRMKALYMLGEDKIVQVIFTAQSAEDLNQSLFYLKRFAQKDFSIVANYKSDLKKLTKKQTRLNKEVRRLLGLRENLEKSEKNLNGKQDQKANYLSTLGKKRQKHLKALKSIKQKGSSDFSRLLDLSFFEKKGSVAAPFSGLLLRGYGIVENDEFGYKLIHKGLAYASEQPKPVRAVFKGRVVHKAEMLTYGQTVIIDHGDHYYTVYAGLNKPRVNIGDEVKAEQVIDESSAQLYFELRHFSDAINPIPWLSVKGSS